MSKLEAAVRSSGNYAFSMRYGAGFPAQILCGGEAFSADGAVVFGDIVHPDDYQPFCEVMNEIVSGRCGELKVHARIKAAGEYRWFYISALPERAPDGTLRGLDGMMFDVSAYLDCDGNDAVMRKFRSKSTAAFANVSTELSLRDILGDEYLVRIQKPFSQINGLFSAISDDTGRIVAVPAEQDRRVNPYKMSYQRKLPIRIRHRDAAFWTIAGESRDAVDSSAQLLETLVQTVADISNSYVVLSEEMENSQNANKLLGQNFEDSILINNIYSIILQKRSTREAAAGVIPLIREYLRLDAVLFSSGFAARADVYRWDESGLLLPIVEEGRALPAAAERELDYGGVACVKESEISTTGFDRACALCRTYENGRSSGVMIFVSHKGDREWTNRERKQIKTLTQILSTVIDKLFTEEELSASRERLERLAYYDFTTNIPNRSMFERDLRAQYESGGTGAVIAAEISNLKSISEIYGIEYFDNILKSCAEYVSAMPCGAQKSVYRFSSDILTVMLRGASREEARQFAQAVLTKFRSPWYLDDSEYRLEIYAGITVYTEDAEDAAECVNAATHALRLAKERKLCDAEFYSEGLEDQLKDSQQVKKLIMDAAENGFKGFYCLYQPVVSLSTGELHCCEANLFWHNEDMTVPKDRFMPIIDRMGLSTQMYCFVADKVCEFCAGVREKGYEGFRVSISVPENIIGTEACVEALRSALLEYSLPPSAVSVSVSEGERTLTAGSVALQQLSKIGVNVIADDRGDSFFTAAPLDIEAVKTVKIRSERFKGDPVSERFIRTLVRDAHSKGKAVCIRDADSESDIERARSMGVDLAEGIYHGRPLHSAEFIAKFVKAV